MKDLVHIKSYSNHTSTIKDMQTITFFIQYGIILLKNCFYSGFSKNHQT